MYRLLYVSRSALANKNFQSEINAIVEVALSRNAAEQVTGALLFTGERFAQYLEGPQRAVLRIMASIMRDKRHLDVSVIEQGDAEGRLFADWAMAYSGRSTFAAVTVERALTEKMGGDGYRGRNLTKLLRELVRSEG